MDEERWQESLNARNTLAANQAIYAAWSAAWTAEATDNIINIYKHFTLRGQRCPYTLQIVEAFSRHCAVNAADVAIYTSDVLEEAFYALINDHSTSIYDNYEDFFFEELPGGEKIYYHLDNIIGQHWEQLRNQTQTTKTDTDPAALLFLREAKRLGKKRQREQLQAHQEQHQDTQQRKRTRTRQRRTPLLMPMDASSASDKKRKVIEGESSPRGLKRMRFG